MMNIDVFISHSSKDALIANAIIDLIRSAYNIPSRRIRCTSVTSTQLPTGVSINETLKEELSSSSLLIAIISKDALSSLFTMFELGARWMTGSCVFTIVRQQDSSPYKNPLKVSTP